MKSEKVFCKTIFYKDKTEKKILRKKERFSLLGLS